MHKTLACHPYMTRKTQEGVRNVDVREIAGNRQQNTNMTTTFDTTKSDESSLLYDPIRDTVTYDRDPHEGKDEGQTSVPITSREARKTRGIWKSPYIISGGL